MSLLINNVYIRSVIVTWCILYWGVFELKKQELDIPVRWIWAFWCIHFRIRKKALGSLDFKKKCDEKQVFILERPYIENWIYIDMHEL